MLREPTNVNGRTNADVVLPWPTGTDVVKRPRDRFIIDFGTDMSESEAAAYETPFAHVEANVRPTRAKNRQKSYRELWWRHIAPRPVMRAALHPLSRFIATPLVSKHRLFTWLSAPVLPDARLIVIARADAYTFGVLPSRVHELWALGTGTHLGVGNDPQYTLTSTFETFPFPWPLDTPEEALTAQQRGQRDAIGAAARALDEARRRWLNPPEWVREEPDVLPSLPPRLLPADEAAERELRRRTLTNLYNQRPQWLVNAHEDLDTAVAKVYGWDADISDEDALRELLELNLAR
jgi:type II restriction/modification system DNA methylase subunit YeeA